MLRRRDSVIEGIFPSYKDTAPTAGFTTLSIKAVFIRSCPTMAENGYFDFPSLIVLLPDGIQITLHHRDAPVCAQQ